MYNDFVIVGPPADPAGIRGLPTAARALQAIAARQAPFVSRGDRSGTHVAELELWKKAGLQPAGAWYRVYEKGSQGNAATLGHVDAQRAYTVIDRATWVTAPERRANLAILVEKDEALLNHISVIPVSPTRFPRANHAGAVAFVRWLTAADGGQKVIEAFGKDRFGGPLFFPESREWQAARR